MHADIADLGYDVDGILGMNFLSDFNFEIRPSERRILVERIGPLGRHRTAAGAAGANPLRLIAAGNR